MISWMSFVWRILFPAPETREAVKAYDTLRKSTPTPPVVPYPQYNASGLPVNDAPDDLPGNAQGVTIAGGSHGQEA